MVTAYGLEGSIIECHLDGSLLPKAACFTDTKLFLSAVNCHDVVCDPMVTAHARTSVSP